MDNTKMWNEQVPSIKTFAILDLEVNDFHKYQFNQCSVTELCFYAISAKCFLQYDIIKNGRETQKAPKLPRVLNKMTLMINPMRRIQDNTRTGLDNYMLENESPFNDDTADCILKFLNRLEKPVCLVAHNGMQHDFRIVRHVYEKLNRTFPSSIYCVDSLKAFRKIDREIELFGNAAIVEKQLQSNEDRDKRNGRITTTSDEDTKEITDPSPKVEEQEHFEDFKDSAKIIKEDSPLNGQQLDETKTPPNNKRVSRSILIAKSKKYKDNDIDQQETQQNTEENSNEDTHMSAPDSPRSRQQINETTPKNKGGLLHWKVEAPGSSTPKRTAHDADMKIKRKLDFNNKCSYKLGELYEYLFKDEKCETLHEAEADVKILTQLILHYGIQFVKYANENKETFDNVPMLGSYYERNRKLE